MKINPICNSRAGTAMPTTAKSERRSARPAAPTMGAEGLTELEVVRSVLILLVPQAPLSGLEPQGAEEPPGVAELPG